MMAQTYRLYERLREEDRLLVEYIRKMKDKSKPLWKEAFDLVSPIEDKDADPTWVDATPQIAIQEATNSLIQATLQPGSQFAEVSDASGDGAYDDVYDKINERMLMTILDTDFYSVIMDVYKSAFTAAGVLMVDRSDGDLSFARVDFPEIAWTIDHTGKINRAVTEVEKPLFMLPRLIPGTEGVVRKYEREGKSKFDAIKIMRLIEQTDERTTAMVFVNEDHIMKYDMPWRAFHLWSVFPNGSDPVGLSPTMTGIRMIRELNKLGKLLMKGALHRALPPLIKVGAQANQYQKLEGGTINTFDAPPEALQYPQDIIYSVEHYREVQAMVKELYGVFPMSPETTAGSTAYGVSVAEAVYHKSIATMATRNERLFIRPVFEASLRERIDAGEIPELLIGDGGKITSSFDTEVAIEVTSGIHKEADRRRAVDKLTAVEKFMPIYQALPNELRMLFDIEHIMRDIARGLDFVVGEDVRSKEEVDKLEAQAQEAQANAQQTQAAVPSG